ncbi:MAG: AMP-binding protein [Solirubrobacteraceae bacterium]|nr:AMP-binding protein [Solirubrobacteraceae bacterium]
MTTTIAPPALAMDFGEVLRRSASQYARNVAVTAGDRRQTYAELFERSSRLAQAIAARGIEPGDRVAMLGPNGPETVEQITGIALGGFVRAALYAHNAADGNAYLCDLVDARLLIVDAPLAEDLLALRDRMPQLEHVLVYGTDTPPAGAESYEAALAAASADDPQVHVGPDALHVIRFSAGTTGRPKGIFHTNRHWMGACDEYRWSSPMLDERDAYLAAAPLTHAAVLFLWQVLKTGGRVIVEPAFDPERFLRLIEQERVTFGFMVPTMIQPMVTHPDAARYDLTSLRCLNYAAAPISETTMLRAKELLGGKDVLFQMYGQSEIWPITMLYPHEHVSEGTETERGRLRSVGRPTPSTKLTIVDKDGNAVPPGTIGEVAARHEGMMSGIWKDPEATAARTLPDGSILTRDMGPSTRTGSSSSPTARRTSSSPADTTSGPPSWRTPSRPTRGSTRSASSACRTSGGARPRARSSSRPPAPR